MKKFIKVVLFLALSLGSGLASVSVALGQDKSNGTDAPPPPPPKASQSPATLDPGKINGFTYTNEQLGFSFSAPRSWFIRDDKAMRAMREESKQLFRDEKDPKLKANLEGSVERTTPLFSATKYAPGTVGTFNASLVCAAERIPTAVVKTPRDYYDIMLHSMNLSEGMKVEELEPFQMIRIGKTAFGVAKIKISSNIGVVIQKQVMAVHGPYVYGLVFSYVETEDAAIFDEVVKSVQSR